jgi:branched-chain amino acid aminotransferase
MPIMESKFVWRNGTIAPWQDATLHVSSHGLHYGTGVFEGIRCYQTERGPAVFRLGAHADRFFASAKVYGLEWRYTRQDLARAVLAVVLANELTDCYIRPIAFFGSDTLSLHPRSCPLEITILAWPWEAYLGPGAHERGVHVTISRWRKFPSEAIPTTAKGCGQYLNSILATKEARAGGFDEALLLNMDGTISEGPGENLFLIRNSQLVTNDERSSVLPGITRDSVLRLAARLNIPVRIREIELDDLLSADEAFFTGTAVEIVPVVRVDGHAVGSGVPGPRTKQLRQAFFDVVLARDLHHLDWLTFVSQADRNRASPEGDKKG